MKLNFELHRMNYRPLIPDGKIVKTRGAVNQTALVIFWLWWIINIEKAE